VTLSLVQTSDIAQQTPAKFSFMYVVACTYNIDLAGIFV